MKTKISKKHERAVGGKINMKNLPSCQYSQKHKWNQEKTGVFSLETRVSSEGCGHLLRPRLEGTRSFLLACWFLVTESSLTLCEPLAWSPPGSCVHGILQVRILDRQSCHFLLHRTFLTRDRTLVSRVSRQILYH